MNSFYPGKVILTGEHSVVYGQPALLATIELGVSCQVESGRLANELRQDAYLQQILHICARELGLQQRLADELQLTLRSNLPTQAGLGSSAAFAAAVIAAVMAHYGQVLVPAALYKLVFEAEQFVHGRSSGADPSIVVHGGCLRFQQGQATPIDSQLLAQHTFALLDSGTASESTGELVTLAAAHPQREALVKALGQLSQKFIQELQQGRLEAALLRENQALLSQLGVVGQAALSMIEELQRRNLTVKITGAGGVRTGSGYLLVYHPDPQFLAAQIQDFPGHQRLTQLGVARAKSLESHHDH